MICTFYSYKGGVGRSMALANVAMLLYQQGFRVLMVDFDLEAPGLDQYFYRFSKSADDEISYLGASDISKNPSVDKDYIKRTKTLEGDLKPPTAQLGTNLEQTRGLMDMLQSYKELYSLPRLGPSDSSSQGPESESRFAPEFIEPLSNFILEIKRSPKGGSLSIITAGRRDDAYLANYSKAVRTFNWNDFYANWDGERFFEWFREEAESISDIVLIDSRTGTTEMGGVCTHHLADVVVMFSAPNKQNLDGVLTLAKSLSNPELIEKRNDKAVSMIFVPSRIDPFESPSLATFAALFKEGVKKYISDKSRFDEGIFDTLKIPYIPYYSYMENLAVCDIDNPNARDLVAAFKRLIKAIAEVSPETSIISRLVRVTNIKITRNPYFTGRADILLDIRSILTRYKSDPYSEASLNAPISIALTGLGGVGKTQIALEYAYRYMADYLVVWWLPSNDPVTLADDYTKLAFELNLPEKDSSDTKSIIYAVRTWLERNSRWLLIFDDAQSPEEIDIFIPRTGNGRIIITSRSRNWGSLAYDRNVGPLSETESIEFLKRFIVSQDPSGIPELAESLGGLPLSLALAGAYIRDSGISMAEYVMRLNEEKTPFELETALSSVIGSSIDAVGKSEPLTLDILKICAFLSTDPIPRHIFTDGANFLNQELASSVNDKIKFESLIAKLASYSLIAIDSDAFEVHKMVQMLVRNRLNNEEKRIYATISTQLVNSSFKFDPNDPNTWTECSELLSHALIVADHADKLGVVPNTAGRLLNEVGLLLKTNSRLLESKSAIEKALSLYEGVYGKDDINVAIVANNLGQVLQDLGDLQGARLYLERALKIFEKNYDFDHSEVAVTLGNLGLVLKDLGDLQGARDYQEQALNIYEKIYGPDHLAVATTLENVGLVLRDLDDLQGAKKYLERALKINEKVYGPEHPTVAVTLGALGTVLSLMGNLEAAKEIFEKAIDIDEKALGSSNPSVAAMANNLALVLQDMGMVSDARLLFQKALKIYTYTLGEDAPDTTIVKDNISLLKLD